MSKRQIKLTSAMEKALEVESKMLEFIAFYESSLEEVKKHNKKIKENKKMEGTEKLILLNGMKLTEKEFIKEKENISKQKGVRLVEMSPDVFATRILG
jgi:hypothetical protein